MRFSIGCAHTLEKRRRRDRVPPHQSTSDPTSNDGATSLLVQVSRAIVAVYKEQFGRGPERVRSYFAGPDAIVCFLEGTLTPVERTLAAINEDQRLREMRTLFQHTAEATFREAVEQITGRSVIAFSSGIDTNADVATEVFVLEPRSSA
jgi:uncharacterized protein YbcI